MVAIVGHSLKQCIPKIKQPAYTLQKYDQAANKWSLDGQLQISAFGVGWKSKMINNAGLERDHSL